jgi:hypothetical protein
MSLRELALKVLVGTANGTDKGTHCPTPLLKTSPDNTTKSGNGTGFADKITPCPMRFIPRGGTNGTTTENGTANGTDCGTDTPGPILAGCSVLLTYPQMGDMWLAKDEESARALDPVSVPVLLEADMQWALTVDGHEARLERLWQLYGIRHPATRAAMEVFPGAKVTSVHFRGNDR